MVETGERVMDDKCLGCKYNLDNVCHFDDDKGCALEYQEEK